MQSLKVQTATRKTQRNKQNLKTQKELFIERGGNQATQRGLRKAFHNGALETQANDGLDS